MSLRIATGGNVDAGLEWPASAPLSLSAAPNRADTPAEAPAAEAVGAEAPVAAEGATPRGVGRAAAAVRRSMRAATALREAHSGTLAKEAKTKTNTART